MARKEQMTKKEFAEVEAIADDITKMQERVEKLAKSERAKAWNVGMSQADFTGASQPLEFGAEALELTYKHLNVAYHELSRAIEANGG